MQPVILGDDRHRSHDPPFELNAGQHVAPVWEQPARIDAIAGALRAAGYRIAAPEPCDDEVLTTVHAAAMVDFARHGYAQWLEAGGPEVMIPDTFPPPAALRHGRCPTSPLGAAGWWCTDTATPIVAGTYAAARAGVDLAVTGADLLVGGTEAVYALTRPPGHHAGPDSYGGFCLFNPAAIAARRLSEHGPVAVLDLDVHHGNGTQDIFWRDGQVLVVSLHGDPDHLYPFFSGRAEERGEGPGHGATHNLPLPAGTADEAYLRVLHTAAEVIHDHGPLAVVVSLGFDTSSADPIGSMALSTDAYLRIGRLLRDLGRPLLLIQEGGYAIDRLGDYATAVLDGLTEPT